MQMLGFRGNSGAKDTETSPGPPNGSANPSSASHGAARPLRLVYCDEKGKFVMDPEAVAVLQLVKGPVGVVAVCGRARQGKSFILNQVFFLNSTPLFQGYNNAYIFLFLTLVYLWLPNSCFVYWSIRSVSVNIGLWNNFLLPMKAALPLRELAQISFDADSAILFLWKFPDTFLKCHRLILQKF